MHDAYPTDAILLPASYYQFTSATRTPIDHEPSVAGVTDSLVYNVGVGYT